MASKLSKSGINVAFVSAGYPGLASFAKEQSRVVRVRPVQVSVAESTDEDLDRRVKACPHVEVVGSNPDSRSMGCRSKVVYVLGLNYEDVQMYSQAPWCT